MTDRVSGSDISKWQMEDDEDVGVPAIAAACCSIPLITVLLVLLFFYLCMRL
jgi:hypothetical protein